VIVTTSGYEVETFAGGAEVLSCADPQPGAVLLDLMMPEVDGVAVLKELKRRHPSLPVIILTAVNEVSRAVEVTKLGAYDYLVKPIDQERLKTTLNRAVSHGSLSNEVVRLKTQLSDRYDIKSIVGSSAAMRQVYSQIEKVLSSDITIFISGESGTGKELAAKAIHFGSLRSDEPFIDVNCAAIPEGLQESELFGHEKGAFTGALATHPGKFEQAAGGTIFLDEVGEMSPSAQARLLRVLQERCLQRVGGTKTINLDVRVISASNRDLEQMVADGGFRQDLFYRVNVVPLALPPLRERLEDIALLAQTFLDRGFAELGRDREEEKNADGTPTLRQTPLLARPVRAALEAYRWPGNVRELENAIEHGLALCEGPSIELAHMPEAIHRAGGDEALREDWRRGQISFDDTVARFEETILREALEQSAWNQTRAAAAVGLTRRVLKLKMDKLAIEPPPG